MNPVPKISVVVCTYNQEKTIGRALDSILNQKTDFPYEIILSDDCSSDGTPMICAEYAGKFPDIIRFFGNECNKGLVKNYFDSIKLCRGEYIADLAGDDEWTDASKLQSQLAIMEKDKTIVLCHSDWTAVSSDGTQAFSSFWSQRELKISVPGELTETLLRHEKEKYFIHLCTALYRRDAVLAIMKKYPEFFHEKYLTCEDLQVSVLLSATGKIVYLPKNVLNYTVGSPTVSSDEDPVKTIRFYSGVIKLTMRLADSLGISRQSLKQYTSDVMQFLIMKYFVTENETGRKLLKDLLREEKIPISIKNRMTLKLSSNSRIWKFSNKIRNLIKG